MFDHEKQVLGGLVLYLKMKKEEGEREGTKKP